MKKILTYIIIIVSLVLWIRGAFTLLWTNNVSSTPSVVTIKQHTEKQLSKQLPSKETPYDSTQASQPHAPQSAQ